MSVDIRARVFSNRGEVISGGFSDDHVQGTGLVRCKGEVVLKGLVPLSTGSVIDLGYEKGGRVIRFPRYFYVLSSFADPFRRITTVSIGCGLTLNESFREAEKTDNLKDPINAGKPCEFYAKSPPYITFSHIASVCASKLGVSSSGVGTGYIASEKYDFSAGYFSILSDLLYSNSTFGYMTAGGGYSTSSATGGSGGAVLDEDDIIDVSPITSGDIPPNSVIVDYSYNRFKQPPDEPKEEPPAKKEENKKRNWEKDITQGELQYAYVYYNKSNSVYQHRFYPLTVTETTYDALDRVLERKSKTVTAGVVVNSAYCSEFLDKTGGIDSRFFEVEEITTTKFNYQFAAENLIVLPTTLDPCRSYNFSINISTHAYYDPEIHDQVISEVTVKEESDLALAGAVNLPTYVYYVYTWSPPINGVITLLNTTTNYMRPGTAVSPSEITTVVYETDVEQGISKTITERYLAYAFTPPGQQGLAKMAKNVKTIEGANNILFAGRSLVSQGSSVQTHVSRNFGVQKRPSVMDRLLDEYKKAPRTEKAEIEFLENVSQFDGEATGRVITYSMPFASDDYVDIDKYKMQQQFNSTGANTDIFFLRTASNAPEAARSFGSTQRRLAYGHRNGFSIQTVPEKLPPHPGMGVTLRLGGIAAYYMTNAHSWSFDSNGIVASCDLIYMGGIGATSAEYRVPAAWAPVQDGITQLPLAPAVTTTTPIPPNSLPTPVGFTPANPGAIFDTLPINTPQVPEKSIPPSVILPPYREAISHRLEVLIGLTVTRTLISLPEPDRPALVLTKLGAAVERFVYDARTLSGGVKPGLTIEQLYYDPRTAALGVKVGSSITGEYPLPTFDFVSGNALPLLGSTITTGTPTGWVQAYSGNVDDTPLEIALPFAFPFNGVSYNSFWLSPNGYITFGSGSSLYPGTATSPALPKILINSADDSMQKVLTRSTANTFRVRVDGNISSSGGDAAFARTFEVAFFRPSFTDGLAVIEVRIGASPSVSGLLNVYSATAVLSTDPAPTPAANSSWVFASFTTTGTIWYIFPAESCTPIE